MKVLHVISDLKIGGSQRLMLDLVERMNTLFDIDQRICVLRDASTLHKGYHPAVPTTYLDFSGDYRRPVRTLKCIRDLRRTIQEWSPDVVHTYLWLSDFIAARAVRGLGPLHVSHIVDRRETFTSSAWKHRLRTTITRRALRDANTHFLAVSEACRTYACAHLHLDPGRVKVAYNAVESEPFRGAAEDASDPNATLIHFGALGRLVDEKGIDYLLEAASLLAEDGLAFQLSIAGEGPNRPALMEQATRLGLDSSIRFLGAVDSVPDFLRDVEIFVVPSIAAEGLPSTILEAMMARRTVIATSVGGAEEAVGHEQEGLLVEPGNPSALAHAMERLCKDGNLRVKLAAKGRERALEHFHLDGMADTVMNAYLDWLP